MDFEKVVSVKNMRESDARTIAERTPSAELMMRAAQGIFDKVKFAGKTCVVCGKGNNGGDGYALACILARHSMDCTIVRAVEGFSKDGLYYYQLAKSLGVNEISLYEAGNLRDTTLLWTACSVQDFRARLRVKLHRQSPK